MAATKHPKNPVRHRPAADEPRFDFAAIAEFLGVTETEAGVILGLNGVRVANHRAHGVPLTRADRYACRIKAHPSEIWTDWYLRGA